MADLDRLGRSLRGLGHTAVPASLASRIGRALDRADGETLHQDTSGISHAKWAPSMHRLPVWRAAALVVACLASALLTWWAVDAGNRTRQLERDVITAHIRALMQDQPVQVASSDQHTVKPWFTGRTDFAPEVKDLASVGFPLVGGRMDYIDGKRVGALVYKRRLHMITVFMWRADEATEDAPHLWSRNGFSLLSWSRGGVAYWAVSDVNGEDLRELQSLM